jgi:hypothetical protein
MFKVVKAWAVYFGNERGKGKFVGLFSTQDGADIASQGKNWYGGAGTVESIHLLQVELEGNSLFFWLQSAEPVELDVNLQAEKDNLRNQALAKLSSAEKAALGL